ncbi:MAG TPA: GyrI-like domain-containing protein [Xanthobacteraceae bacterium]|nr:GyrI-like domain-containing protein [Xanthobacteraceae bacterium]
MWRTANGLARPEQGIVAVLTVLAVLAHCPSPAGAQAQSVEPAEFSGEEVMLEGKPILFIPGKATWDRAFPTLTEKFRIIAAFLRDNNLAAAGPMMTIYTAVSDRDFEFHAAVPIAESSASPLRDGIRNGQSPVGKALKFVHRGSYEAMDMLYEAITNYLDGKRIARTGVFFEEYVTDPLATPEDRLVVNVFVLVK